MLKVFNRNMIVQVLLAIAVLVALWLPAMLTSASMQNVDGAGVLYSMLYSWLGGSPGWAIALSMVLVAAEGVALNLILASAGIVSQTSLMPTLLYIIAASATSQPLSPIILTNAALIVFVSQLMLHGMLLTVSTTKICSATAMLGLCTMIYTPAVVFLLSYLLIVINYRLYNWRDWMALVLGFAAPYVLLVVVLYLGGGLGEWWEGISFPSLHNRLQTDTATGAIANIAVVAVMIIALFSLMSRMGETPVIWQKNSTTVLLLVVGGLALLPLTRLFPIDTAVFAIPFALSGNHLLLPATGHSAHTSHRTKQWVRETLFIVLIAASLIC